MSNLSLNSHKIDVSTSNAPLHIRFALICLNKLTIPTWISYFCFVLSHIQFLAIIVKSAYIALPDNTPNASPVIKALLKYFVVGDWIDYENTTPLLIGMSIITVYILKILGLLVYIHISLALKWRVPGFIQYYWSTLHSLHPLLLFFWIHTYCVEMIKYPAHYEVIRGIKVSLQTMAYFNTIIGCGLALFFSTISLTSKTKDALSSKTSILDSKTIIFKIIIPTLWAKAENNEGVQILTLVLALVNAISHDWIFVKDLPYYRINTLLFSSILQAIQTSLALTCFVTKLVETGGANIGVLTFQVVWLLVVPFAIRAYHRFTWKTILYVFQCDLKDEKNISYIVHKRFILLHFLKCRSIIHEGIIKLLDIDLMYQAKLANIEADSGFAFDELDRNKKLLIRSLKPIYLEILTMKPKSHLAQINLAYFYSKFDNLYLVSNNLLEDAISRGPGYYAEISLNMLRFELQKKLMVQFSQKAGEEQMTEGLNVYNYIINQELLENLKNSIGKQTEMQINFWKEFLESKPSMLNLVNIALKVHYQKQVVKKQWNNLSKIRAKSFITPLTVYGKYSSLINNNPIEGEKLLKRSREDMKRLHRFFKADELSNQTIFSDKSVKITMSGLRSKLGRIIDCSTNISNFYGWQQSEMKDRPIAILMPPFYRQRHDSFLLDHFNTGKTNTLNTTVIVPVKRSNGYIHPTWIHTKVSPVMEKGIFYVGLLRPCKSNQRMVLIRRDGKIDDMSFGFAKDMNLEGKEGQIESDIFALCPQFRQINEAFNLIAEQTIEKPSHLPNHLLHTRNIITLTDRGENTDRPLISARKRHTTIDTPRSRRGSNYDEFPTILQGLTLDRFQSKMDPQNIYENFSAGGCTLTFYPFSETGNKTPKNQANEPIAYSVKVTNSIHGNEVIKYLFLERISGESADEKTDTESSNHDAILPSLNIVLDTEVVNTERKTFFSPKTPHQIDGLLSPPPKAFFPTSPSVFDTEAADLMYMTTSPRMKTEVKFTEQVNEDDDGANLSILDEVQSNDSRDRKVVLRTMFADENNLEEKKPPEVKKKIFNFQEIKSKTLPETKKAPSPRKVDEAIMSSVQQDKEHSMGSSSYLYKGKKAEMMIQALRMEPTKKSAKIYTSLLLLFFLSVIGLLGAQSANLNSGIKEVQSQVPVIGAAFFRQYNMISAATNVRNLKGILDGYVLLFDWETDNLTFLINLNDYLNGLMEYNAQFYELMNKLPEEMQKKFYKKNVGFYNYNDDLTNRTLLGKESPFTAHQIMIEKETRCLYLDIPDQWEPGIDTSNHKFVIDNSLNDLLIQSQDEIDQLTDFFDDSTNSTILKTAIIMGSVLVICVIFILSTIRYLCLLASEAAIFMTMIFRMKSRDCKVIQLTLERFQDWLDTDLKDQDLPIRQNKFKKPRQNATAQNNHNNNSGRFRSASMGSLYRSQRIEFLKLLPILLLFVCWSLLCFFITSNFIGNIQDSKKRMEAALQALNNQTLFVNELVSIALGNSTATFKNKPLGPSFDESLKYLEETSVLIDWFRDRNGDLTPLQQSVLFGFPCEDFVPYLTQDNDYIYAYDSCFTLGKGTDTVGLVDINSQFYDVGLKIRSLYESGTKTLEELGYLFAVGVSIANDLVNSAVGFLKLLYQATYLSFEDEVDMIKRSSLALIISIVIVTVIAIVLTWYFALRKIFKAQKIDWYILQVTPLELIRSNKHLQQYLLNRSDQMLSRFKGFLA